MNIMLRRAAVAVSVSRIDLSWPIYRELAKASLPPRPAIKGDPSKQVALELSTEFTRIVRDE